MAAEGRELQAALTAWEQGDVAGALGLLQELGQQPGQVGVQAQMYLLRGYVQTRQHEAAHKVFLALRQQPYPEIQQWLTAMEGQYGGILGGERALPVREANSLGTGKHPGLRWQAGVTVVGILGLEGLVIAGILSPGGGGWVSGGLAVLVTVVLNGVALWGSPRLLDAWMRRVGGRWLSPAESERWGLRGMRVGQVPGGTVWRYGWGQGIRLVVGEELWQRLGDPERQALLSWGQGDLALAVLTWGSFWGYGLAWIGGRSATGLVQACLSPLYWLARQRTRYWDQALGSQVSSWQRGILSQGQCRWGIGIPVGLWGGSDPEDWGLLAQVSRDPQALAWEQVSPWRHGVGLNRPHPLWQERLSGIPVWNTQVGGFGAGMALYFSDLLLGGIGWGIGAWLWWHQQLPWGSWLGMASVGAGIGMLVKAWRMFPQGPSQSYPVNRLYHLLLAQPVVGIPVQVRGRLVADGLGIWLEDDTGRIRLHWLGKLGPLAGQTRGSGSLVTLQGWLRRGGRVWIDGATWVSGQQRGRAWPRLPLLLGGLLGILGGTGLLLFSL